MEIKYYKPGDELEILGLFRKAFKKPLPSAFWQWRFGDNPFLKNPLISLMWEQESLVGHYGASGVEISMEGQIHSFSLSGTTMTCPGFEGKGIFPSLAHHVYARAAQAEGISGIMGFPNNKSHYALIKKLYWKDVCILPCFSIDNFRIGDSHPFGVHKLIKFEHRHAEFITKTIIGFGFSVFVNRSVSYLNWRYIDCPSSEYACFELIRDNKLAGIIIAKTFDSFANLGAIEVDILEIICEPDITLLEEMIIGVKHFYNGRNVVFQRINMWISIFDPRHLLLEKMGFQIGLPLTFFCAKAFLPGMEAIYDCRNWYLSFGDSDVF